MQVEAVHNNADGASGSESFASRGSFQDAERALAMGSYGQMSV